MKFTDGLRLGVKEELSNNSVFQDEVAAIEVAVELLLQSAASFGEVTIRSSSRAAILALNSITVHSNPVKES